MIDMKSLDSLMKRRETKSILLKVDEENYATIEYVDGNFEEVVLKIDGDLTILSSSNFSMLHELMKLVEVEINCN